MGFEEWYNRGFLGFPCCLLYIPVRVPREPQPWTTNRHKPKTNKQKIPKQNKTKTPKDNKSNLNKTKQKTPKPLQRKWLLLLGKIWPNNRKLFSNVHLTSAEYQRENHILPQLWFYSTQPETELPDSLPLTRSTSLKQTALWSLLCWCQAKR